MERRGSTGRGEAVDEDIVYVHVALGGITALSHVGLQGGWNQ